MRVTYPLTVTEKSHADLIVIFNDYAESFFRNQYSKDKKRYNWSCL